MGGVFLVLTVGVAASFFYTICELLWDVGCTSLRENVGAIESFYDNCPYRCVPMNITINFEMIEFTRL